MSSPSTPVLQQLHRLDRTSSGFHDQLSNVLYGKECRQCVPNLQGDDLVWFVDYLDGALDSLDSASPGFRKCLRELRSTCGTRMVLPTSHTLLSSDLDIGDHPVASGSSADVYEGTLNDSKVCVKRIRVYSTDGPEKAIKTLYQEAVVWKRLEHENIVPLFGITSNPLQLVSDWMPGGDLTEYIKRNHDADRLGLLSDITEGLHFLHSRNIVHGDLKGSNILLDANNHARITDFGLTKVTQNLDSIRSATDDQGHVGRWTAPEILNEEGTYSKEGDVFSFAMVAVEVFTGAVPFSSSLSPAAMLAIMDGRRPPRPTHPALTDQLWALVQRCWGQASHLRPEISEVLKFFDPPLWKRLISSSPPTHERIALITSIFSDRNEVEAVERLSGNDAQAFIDLIDELPRAVGQGLDSLEPHIRRKCLRAVYRICGRQALLPSSLAIPLCYDPTQTPLAHGGFADVWKGQHDGRDVAAKVLRVYMKNDLRKIRRKFCKEVVTWSCLRHPNVLPLLGVMMSGDRFVMVSEWMENASISEFVRAHADADRLKLLGDAARGLVYMHSQGLVHGDLKGENILINRDGHACLADFSLATTISDQQTFLSSCIEGGTTRWMSPELLAPDMFGLKKSRPTRESDCYALGMTIYEILSGQVPFVLFKSSVVIRKVAGGERPERPQGDDGRHFTDGVWGVMQRSWEPQPRKRISARVILMGLEGNPTPVEQPSNTSEDVETDRDDRSESSASDSDPPTARGDNGPPVPPKTGDPKLGRVVSLAHNTRRFLKNITKGLER